MQFPLVPFSLSCVFSLWVASFFWAAVEISVTMDCGTFFILRVDLGMFQVGMILSNGFEHQEPDSPNGTSEWLSMPGTISSGGCSNLCGPESWWKQLFDYHMPVSPKKTGKTSKCLGRNYASVRLEDPFWKKCRKRVSRSWGILTPSVSFPLMPKKGRKVQFDGRVNL